MIEMIRKLQGLDRTQRNMVLTVTGPQPTGEKALFSEGRLIWEDAGSSARINGDEESFFKTHLQEASALTKSGICTLAGKELFCERVGSGKKLIVCGAGHVGQQLIRLGRMLEMDVTALEDREFFAQKAGESGAQRVLCGSYAELLKDLEGSGDSYFVVLTHGHRSDLDCLREILKKKYAYAGMIGSRRHGEIVKKSLREEGVPERILDEVYTPVGLKISARTPAEIAVSIMAEIIRVKNREAAEEGFTDSICRSILSAGEAMLSSGTGGALADQEHTRPGEPVQGVCAVLVTVMKLEGSGPRKPGTKMLVLPDGSIAGTVGGGNGEARAIRAAADMLRRQSSVPEILTEVMMAGPEDSKDMVCGGRTSFLLEAVEIEANRYE